MRDKVFLDTNILVYLANEDSPFHLGATKIFKEKALGFFYFFLFVHNQKTKLRNGDEITSTSRRIDLDQICSISNHKS